MKTYMNNGSRFASGKDVFPIIEEQLNKGVHVWFTVSGTSMMPWIVHNRDKVELVSSKHMELKKGDIVLFSPMPEKYILHRITKVFPDGYVTAGDGNLYEDGYISRHKIIGKVVQIQRKGKYINCDAFIWKCIFQIWMYLCPIRKYLLKYLGCIGKMKLFFRNIIGK